MKPSRIREPEIDRLGRETFINLFLASGRYTDQVEATCKAEGLTMSHYTVLWVVCLSVGQAVPMRTVADGFLTRAADATRLVDKLARDGFIARSNSLEDRRVVLVRATRSGHALFKKLTTSIKALHRSQWSKLSVGELRELRRLLVKSLWGESSAKGRHPLEALRPGV